MGASAAHGVAPLLPHELQRAGAKAVRRLGSAAGTHAELHRGASAVDATEPIGEPSLDQTTRAQLTTHAGSTDNTRNAARPPGWAHFEPLAGCAMMLLVVGYTTGGLQVWDVECATPRRIFSHRCISGDPCQPTRCARVLARTAAAPAAAAAAPALGAGTPSPSPSLFWRPL